MRKYFEKYRAGTHQQRRQMLCRLSSGNLLSAAVWMHAHPGDLWNTVKERKRGWTRMFADDYAKDIATVHAITGFYDEPYVDPDGSIENTARARAEIVGRMRAHQEMFFGPDWFDD
jgi:hypothetical protein